MDPLASVVSVLAAAGGGAGVTRLLTGRAESEHIAVQTLQLVLKELRLELESKIEDLHELEEKLNLASNLIDDMANGDLPGYLS